MTKRTGRILKISALVTVCGLLVADYYPQLRFRGDGSFSGGPVFGYTLKLRPIPFYEAGKYVYHFRGMPNEEMTLELYVEGRTHKDYELLTHLQTNLEFVLTDQNRHIACQGTGLPLHGDINDRPNGWVLMSSPVDTAYWHWNFLHLQLNSSDSYTLTLRVRDVDPETPKTYLIPVISGGHPVMP